MKFIAFEYARSVVPFGRRIHDENPSSLLGGGGGDGGVGVILVDSFVDDRDDDVTSIPAVIPPPSTMPPRNDDPIIGRAHRRRRSINAPLDRASMARMTRDMPCVQRPHRRFILARAIAYADDDPNDDVGDRRCRR
jgi:hypothetical protein